MTAFDPGIVTGASIFKISSYQLFGEVTNNQGKIV
jgi:hypothetical protein